MKPSAHRLSPIPSALILLLAGGCSLFESDPDGSGRSIDDTYRIVWRLESVEQSDAHRDVDRYEPFRLVFDSTGFVGDDGCNRFQAPYESRENHVVPGQLRMTLKACGSLVRYPAQHLASPFAVEIGNETLTVSTSDGRYHYRGAHMAPVERSPLVGRSWRLASSTDPALDDLAEEYIPEITFESTREYTIEWRCTADNPFGCNRFGGFWGIGERDAIVFFPLTSVVSGTANASSIDGLQRVSAYQLEDGDLIVIGADREALHRFTPR